MNVFIDQIPCESIVGIDFNHFPLRVKQEFHGFKGIPTDEQSAIHVIHFQHRETGVRYGYWFFSKESESIRFSYDIEREIMVPAEIGADSTHHRRFQECQHLMLDYPKDENYDDWIVLTNQIRWKEVTHWCENVAWNKALPYVDSSMTTMEENRLLQKTVMSGSKPNAKQGTILVPSNEPTLRYTPIKFKSNEAIRSAHKMEDFLDKSWYLCNQILPKYHYQNLHSLFGELQFCFLNSMLFANYGSSLQWHSILELLAFSTCLAHDPKYKDIVPTLDALLALQTTRIPEEYVEFLLNEDLLVRILTMSPIQSLLPLWRRQVEDRHLLHTDHVTTQDSLQAEHGRYSDTDNEDGPVVVSRTVYYDRNLPHPHHSRIEPADNHNDNDD